MQVFIVDDDNASRMIAAAALGTPGYALREFADGPSLLDAVEDVEPDLILLDIEMPGMDGISACSALRAGGHNAPQVMFVSSHNDLDTRLTAYDAGGNDFIVKPYEPAELARKAAVAQQHAEKRKGIVGQAQEAQRAAFTAMSTLGEMGVVLECLRGFSACDAPEAVADRLVDGLNQFGLDGFFEMRLDGQPQCRSVRGECTALERSILEHARGMDRIFQFRDRLVINYPKVTLIVQALPLDDPDRVGRLRDHLAILAEGAEVRLRAVETARRQVAQAGGIGEAVAELIRTLDGIEKTQAEHRARAALINEGYLRELVGAFVHLGLTDGQEATLSELAQQTHAQLTALRDEDSGVSDRLRAVVQRLQKLASL